MSNVEDALGEIEEGLLQAFRFGLEAYQAQGDVKLGGREPPSRELVQLGLQLHKALLSRFELILKAQPTSQGDFDTPEEALLALEAEASRLRGIIQKQKELDAIRAGAVGNA